MSQLKYCAITGSLGQVSDRFMAGGYKEEAEVTFDKVAKNLADLGVLDGAELCYKSEGLESDAEAVSRILASNNLAPSYVNSALFNERRWQKGSLSSADPEIRKQALQNCMDLIDFTDAVGGIGVNLWLGQDGFDYPFQTDYKKQWNYLVDALKTLGDYNPKIKITIEGKIREPRNRSLVNTTPTGLLMCMEADRKNVGMTVDVGHVLQAGMNMAQDLEIADKFGKLFNIHVNDNYGSWDDDMIVGSVHLIEFIEMFYVLKKIGYDRWVSVDIFPFREDQYKATKECVLYMKKYEALVDKIGFDKLEKEIEKGDACEMMKLIRETVL